MTPEVEATREQRLGVLQRLCRIPSAVPLGPETLIDPDDPIIANYVARGPLAELRAIGGLDIVELPLGQYAVRLGTGKGPSLALMAYTPTQHNNLMLNPWSGDVRAAPEYGIPEDCVFGQGVSQNKVHQAALIDLASRLSSREIRGTLWLIINNEGRSSHACSTAALQALPELPDAVVQLFPTDLAISLGNRGRIDIRVTITATPTHSSQPLPATERVIDVAAEFVRLLGELDEELQSLTHPVLGTERVVVYQQAFDPVAPHTMPESSRLIVDRRLLPDTDIPEAVAQVQRIGAQLENDRCTIVVEPHVTMLPALLDADSPIVAAVERAAAAVTGSTPPHMVLGGTFDAGGPMSLGVPTIAYGAAGGDGLLGDDWVTVSDYETECAVLERLVEEFMSPSHSAG